MKKYKNRYRISSARLQSWDYGRNAAYFVTICTHNRIRFLGKIVKTQNPSTPQQMELSEIGELVEKFWYEIPSHYPFVELDAFVVMPDHIHGIIIINKPNDTATTPNRGGEKSPDLRDGKSPDLRGVETPKLGVSTTPKLGVSTPKTGRGGKNERWKPNTLGSIINQYKRICTINARKINPKWKWQSRFHDHIIRDNASFLRIRQYIIDNPLNWEG